MDNYPISSNSLEKFFYVNGTQLGQQYKEYLSGFKTWDQKEHASEWILFPDNIGPYLSLDETALSNGELYTVLTNKEGKGKKRTLIAMIEGTEADKVIDVINRIPEKARALVKEVTLDMAGSMNKIAKRCFPSASRVTDRFHVQKLAYDALQEMRIAHRWDAINEETNAIENAKLNNDDKKDIVTTTGIYFQGKTPAEWTFVNIGRSGQGTFTANILNNKDGFDDVIGLYSNGGKNKIAWFENPGHTGGNPVTGIWIPRIIDANPGGDSCNFEMTTMAFTAGDINADGRIDLVCASQGEGPGSGDDNRQIGDGLVWYEAPADPRLGKWTKHIIDATVAWVHASSIKLADFDGDGYLDVNYAQQDQSRDRKDGNSGKQQLGIFYNTDGKGTTWRKQVLSQFPDPGAGGFNSKVGIVGNDTLPSIFTSLHGYFKDANPLMLWKNH